MVRHHTHVCFIPLSSTACLRLPFLETVGHRLPSTAGRPSSWLGISLFTRPGGRGGNAVFVSQMETVRSLPQNPSMPMRQPSAEDLDAAQQLISSAQTGREHSADQYRENVGLRASESHAQVSPSEVDPDQWTDEHSNAKASEKASARTQKDTPFLGHSCR